MFEMKSKFKWLLSNLAIIFINFPEISFYESVMHSMGVIHTSVCLLYNELSDCKAGNEFYSQSNLPNSHRLEVRNRKFTLLNDLLCAKFFFCSSLFHTQQENVPFGHSVTNRPKS